MNFKKIYNESISSSRILRFKISNCITYDGKDDEDIAFDKALGIGLDKTFSFSELKSLINDLPEKMEIYFKEKNKNPNLVKVECILNGIEDFYYHPSCKIKFDRTDIYDSGIKTGDYIELFIQFDYKSLEEALN